MPTKLDEMLLLLGELKAGQQHASEGRKVLHDRLDRVTEVISEARDEIRHTNKTLDQTNFALKITTDLAIQTRDNFNAFKKKFDEEAAPLIEGVSTFREDAAPVLEQIKKARTSIIVLIAVLGLFGVTTGGVLMFANDFAKAIIREWLDYEPPSPIPPIS